MVNFETSKDMLCYESGSFWADFIVDILFWFDTALNFFFAFEDEETKTIVTNRAAIRAKFLRSSAFIINVVACTQPFFTILTCSILPSRNILVLLQLPRMLRILLFMPQFNTLKVSRRESG
jgi:hypothetical protein